MRYISKMHIKTFKGVENIDLNHFGDMNILVGDNNTCKTTVLEAIQLFQRPTSLRELLRISRKREINRRRPGGLTVMESFLNMFNANQNEDKKIEVNACIREIDEKICIQGSLQEIHLVIDEIEELSKYSRSKKYELTEEEPVQEFIGEMIYNDHVEKISLNEYVDVYRNAIKRDVESQEKVIEMHYVSSIDHVNEVFSNNILKDAIMTDNKSSLLGLLNLFDDDIVGLELLPKKYSNFSSVYLKHRQYGYMPLSSFGDGINKVLALASAVISSRGGVLLIDEIETAIHTSALDGVFEWLLKVAKENKIQIFATTHSDEALRSFLVESKNSKFDVSVYRLEKFHNEIIPRHFYSDKAYDIVVNNGGDLR